MRISRRRALKLLACAGLGATALPRKSRAADPAPVTIQASPTKITFKAGPRLIGEYHVGPKVAKPYFWPLNSPDGTPITRAWPMVANEPNTQKDHPHQKSAWFCHGDVIPEGLTLKYKIPHVEGVDFWSENKGHGKIVCTKVGTPEQDGSRGRVTTHNEWRTADGQKVLDETRTIGLYNFGDAQLFVFNIDLVASVVPLTFGDTKEGSFGVRVRPGITEKVGKGRLTNAGGKQGEKNCWGRLSAWCDYSGPVEGKEEGIAIFADPSNPLPSCWHSRGYGLMAANPFGRSKSGFPAMKGKTDLVHLDKGQHLKLRYGLLLHRGDVKQGRVAEYYERFKKLKG